MTTDLLMLASHLNEGLKDRLDGRMAARAKADDLGISITSERPVAGSTALGRIVLEGRIWVFKPQCGERKTFECAADLVDRVVRYVGDEVGRELSVGRHVRFDWT